VGIAFDFQIVERVPREPHDVPVGTIITEQRIIVIPETERETPQ
jgi:5-formyltetrahydrofolate cyclo-ligase